MLTYRLTLGCNYKCDDNEIVPILVTGNTFSIKKWKTHFVKTNSRSEEIDIDYCSVCLNLYPYFQLYSKMLVITKTFRPEQLGGRLVPEILISHCEKTNNRSGNLFSTSKSITWNSVVFKTVVYKGEKKRKVLFLTL